MDKFIEYRKILKIFSIIGIKLGKLFSLGIILNKLKLIFTQQNLKKLFALGIIFLLITSSFLIFIPKIEAQNRFSGKGSGTPNDPYVITNVKQLQEMKYDLKAYYVLGNDIDASETRYWNNGQGFEPIGDKDNPFTGSFDGRGHKIYNLYINTARNYVGLFGYVGKKGILKNVGLENVEISSKGGYDVGYYVGGLIGHNNGTVSNCYSTGSVNGKGGVGGLIGWNVGTVSNCYSTGSVNGTTLVGGLVGFNHNGIVSNCYSTGSVEGYYHVGGLVGDNLGIVSNCYSTGSVEGYYHVGGLVGDNLGIVSNCYSTGSVNGTVDVGGLVGDNYRGEVSNCYSTGSVKGKEYVGGLIGHNNGTVSNCYSTGSVNGEAWIGGLVGVNYYNGTVSNCYSTGFVNGAYSVGGLIGWNGGTVSNSFWDIQTSGLTISAGGTGKTTEQMKNVRTYTDVIWSKGLDSPWDFVGNPYDDKGNEDIWDIKPNINNGYPYLTTTPPIPLTPSPSPTTTTSAQTSPTQTTYTTTLTTSPTTTPTTTTQTLITTTSPITSPTTTPPKTTSPTSPFTKPSEQSMDIMNIIGLILVMIAVLVFISAAVFYFRGRKPDTKRIRYPEEKPPPVLAGEKAYPAATKTLEETISKPSILKMEATKLSIDEWGKILVNVKGKGKVSINLEGNVEWKDPGINEISGESTIEIPVKPKVSGDVPVKVIIDTPYGKESSMIFLKVEKKEVIPPQFVTPITVKEKVGLDEIIPLRNIPLKNLVSGYGCSSSKLFKVNLSTPTVPKEFEGIWNCCLLGCGGWGCAYLATRGNEKIVIKVPRGFESVIEGSIEAPTSHEALLKKIRSETEIMGSLSHPNIIKFLGASSRIPLVIYEFADYGSLYWQIIKGWRPSLRDAVLVGIQLGDALRYIHSRGLIHGDIKLSNVFIKNGVAKLGDFSSTVKLLSSVSISKLPYTVGFRAPEQVFLELKRKARELGVENRIDIYQLGNLLLYILTGESIDGEDADDEKYVMEKLSMVPNEELRAILEEALKLEPDKRPSAEEITKKLYDIWRKIAQ
jgi:hypothetical protein